MKQIKVNLKDSPYNIEIGNEALTLFSKYIESLKTDKILFVIDKNAYKYHKGEIDLLSSLTEIENYKIVILPNEKKKNHEYLFKIYDKLLVKGFSRKSTLVAVGGGIIGDMAGFAAATFMRGIKFVQIPTTLLSMVDSSVGGKTAINYGETKNIIGAFYQPEFVLCDTRFLSSLKHDEKVCGLGEIIKYAFLKEKKFFDFLHKNFNKILENDEKVVQKIIYESLSFKTSVVLEDEKEKSVRKVLNLGHTFGHAFEIEQNHRIKHGQAVIAGVISALFTSNKVGLLEKELLDYYLGMLAVFKKEIKFKNPDIDKMIKIMSRDKKNDSGKINFVLLKEIGSICLDVNPDYRVIKDSLLKTFEFLK